MMQKLARGGIWKLYCIKWLFDILFKHRAWRSDLELYHVNEPTWQLILDEVIDVELREWTSDDGDVDIWKRRYLYFLDKTWMRCITKWCGVQLRYRFGLRVPFWWSLIWRSWNMEQYQPMFCSHGSINFFTKSRLLGQSTMCRTTDTYLNQVRFSTVGFV